MGSTGTDGTGKQTTSSPKRKIFLIGYSYYLFKALSKKKSRGRLRPLKIVVQGSKIYSTALPACITLLRESGICQLVRKKHVPETIQIYSLQQIIH